MVFHWPEAECRDALAQSMREMRDALASLPGCIAVDPPYLTDDACLVGISKWESREAFFAGVTLGPADEVIEGETRPRQRFLLEEVVETDLHRRAPSSS